MAARCRERAESATTGPRGRGFFCNDSVSNADLLERLASAVGDRGLHGYAWSQIPNHVHLLIRKGSGIRFSGSATAPRRQASLPGTYMAWLASVADGPAARRHIRFVYKMLR